MTRVLTIAWDAPDLEHLRIGVRDGWLPTLAGLAERGTFALLDDAQEVLTAASWPTLARGVPLAHHGLVNDSQLVRGEYRVAPVSGDVDGEAPPFWAYLDRSGRRTTHLSVYSAGMVPGLLGTQVVGWGSHDPYTTKHGDPRADPPELLAELDRLAGPRRLKHGRQLPEHADTAGELAYLDDVLRGLDQQATAIRHLMARDPWDFMIASLPDGHEAGHLLWYHHDPSHPDHDPGADPRLLDAYDTIARATDAALARVLDGLPEDVVVLVINAYGMGRNTYLHETVKPVLCAGGWMAELPEGAASRDRRAAALGTVRRVARATLPRRMRQRIARAAGNVNLNDPLYFARFDPTRSRAFALPTDGPALIRVNLAGREPAGIVAPEDYEAVRDGVIAELEELRDADTGEPVASRVARIEEVGGGPARGAMPDVVAAWSRTAFPRALRTSGGAEIPVSRLERNSSTHWSTGFVLGAGPGIPARDSGLDGPSGELVDLAATVFALLEAEQPAELTGSPLFGLVPAGARS